MIDKGRLKRLLIGTGAYRPARLLRERSPSHRAYLAAIRGLYSRFVRPGDLCIDVGAHIGRRSDALLSLGARVVALEPNPSVYRELTAYLGGRPGFHGVNRAVGREPGMAALRVGNWSEISTLNPDQEDHGVGWAGTVEVEVTTLDAIIAEFGCPSFIKIDVEGFEAEVLAGLGRPIRTISFEYHAGGLDQAGSCLARLARFGPVEVNVSPMETQELMSESWWNLESFAAYLKDGLAHRSDCAWGDIFVRTKEDV